MRLWSGGRVNSLWCKKLIFLRIIKWISFLKAVILHFIKGKCPDKMCQHGIECMCEIFLRPVSTSKGKNLMQKYGHHEHVSRLGTQFSSQTKVQDTVGGVLIETYITIRLHTVLSEVKEVIRACKCLDLRACKGQFWRYAASGVCKNGTSITPLILRGVCSCLFYKINSIDQSLTSDDGRHSVEQIFLQLL